MGAVPVAAALDRNESGRVSAMAELLRRGPGCCVVNGRLAGMQLYSVQPGIESVSETPREPRATPPRVEAAPDRARQLVQECDGRAARTDSRQAVSHCADAPGLIGEGHQERA